MHRLAMGQGFVHSSTPGSLLVLPPGYITVCVNVSEDTAVHGIRWLIPGSRHTVNKAAAVAPRGNDAKSNAINDFVERFLAE